MDFPPLRAAALAVAAVVLLASACGDDSTSGPIYSVDATPLVSATPTIPPAASANAGSPSAPATAPATMKLTSPAFAEGANIPSEYSCDGKSSSPEIAWTGAPTGAKAFALVLHDPDAPQSGGFTHWVL
jgi:Phosphatidylethanolamine-binding protein